MENQELLTVEELSKILKVKPSWIYFRTMQTGVNAIPRVRIGKYLRFNKESVLSWIEANYNEIQ